MPTMTYDQRLDAVRQYLSTSDELAMELHGTLDDHNCRLDGLLREVLRSEAVISSDGDIIKRSAFAIRSIAVMILLGSLPGNRIISGILSQCALEGILRLVEFPDFLPRLHRAVHEEEGLLAELIQENAED